MKLRKLLSVLIIAILAMCGNQLVHSDPLSVVYYSTTSEENTLSPAFYASSSLAVPNLTLYSTGGTMSEGFTYTSGTSYNVLLTLTHVSAGVDTATFIVGNAAPLAETVTRGTNLLIETSSSDPNVVSSLFALTLNDLSTGQSISTNSIVADGADSHTNVQGEEIRGLSIGGLDINDSYTLSFQYNPSGRNGMLGTSSSVGFKAGEFYEGGAVSAPEPSEFALLIMGIVALYLAGTRRKKVYI